jgi:outer membrane protein OmpA-like peptidoglycan-associated protein
MNKIIVSLCISFSIVFTSCYSQVQTIKNVDKKAANFATEGIISMRQGQIDKAIEYLKMSLEIAPNFIDANSTLGLLYYDFKKDNIKAEEYLLKTIKLDPNYDFNVYITLAQIKLSQQKFDEAKEFASYVVNSKEESASERLKKECRRIIANSEFAEEAMKNPVEYNPKNLGNAINSKSDDYFAALTADEQNLYYTRIEHSRVSFPQEDIYESKFNNGIWSNSIPLSASINSPEYNEGAIAVSPTGKYLFFTKCESPDCIGSCDIFLAKRLGSEWVNPNNLSPIINTRGKETQPSISGDGKDLYFVKSTANNRLDIYVSHLDEKTGFGTPISLGDIINTEFDEERPFIHPDNKTLYFVSNGHPGMGGMDIFMSKKDADGNWSKPINLGYPINTSDDEYGLFVSTLKNTAYISSERKEGFGGLDIYSFELPKESRPDEVTYVKGIITDADTKMMLQANIQLYDVATGQKITSMTSDAKNGSFLVTLPIGKDYMCNVSKDGYLFYSENFSLIDYTDKEPFLLDIQLNKIKEGVSIVLKNIFFETAKATLKDESKTELNKLVELLTKNPTIKIEIGGHTDNVGVDAENLKLSDARAVAVKNYLTANGISADRLSTKGYGETQPIADNNTEVGRAKNRRTEFKVISK